MKPAKPAILSEADQPEGASVQKSENRLAAGICVLLALAVFAVFGQTVRYEFVNFDDDLYVYQNPVVMKGLTFQGVSHVFTNRMCDFYIPLTMMSLMLDNQIYGLNAGGYHLTNVLLHAAMTILLFLVLRRMLGTRTDKSVGAAAAQSGALWSSAFVAAVFAIHPLRVESVAWVTERKDMLSGLFFILTLGAYIRYTRTLFSLVRYLTVILLFALGLLSKPSLVTLPFLLLLLDYWPLLRMQPAPPRSTFKVLLSLIMEKIPLFVLSAATCVATILTQQKSDASADQLPLPFRLGNAAVSYVAYLGQMIYPADLAVLYPHPGKVLPLPEVASALVLLTVICVVVMALGRCCPYLLVGWLWYLGMLLPMIGVVQASGIVARADRFTYLSQIGIYLLIAWGLKNLFSPWRHGREMLGIAAFIVIASLMACTSVQTSYWRNGESLWNHTLACTSRNAVGHNNLGNLYADQGRTAKAIEHYQAALELKPDFAEAHNNLGTVLAAQGHAAEAVDQYLRALEFKPGYAMAHYNLGAALAKKGLYAEAIQHYQRALEIKSDFAESHNNLGSILDGQGRSLEAIEHFKRAVEIKPDFAEAHFNLGVVLTTQGQAAEAIEHYRQALKIKSDYAEAHYRLALALKGQGRFQEAIAHYRKVLELKHRPMLAQNALAWLLATCPEATWRNGSQAVELSQQAEQLSGGRLPEILDTLAAAYAEAGRFPEAVTTAGQALRLAEAQGNATLAESIRDRLKLYETNSPYRENP